MKQFAALFILIFTFAAAEAQTIITGRVVDEKGEPLPGANAFLDGTYDGASTDIDGTFLFETEETGHQLLKIAFLGFEPFTKELELKNDSISVQVILKESFNELNAVTITAGTFEASDKKKAVTISPLDMVTTAGANGDVYGALHSLPGTTTVGESGRLFVKGGGSEESQTYIDGAWVPVPYSSSAPNFGARGRFNPFMFKGMVFSTGGYSAEYGQALSSVLLLNTNDLPEEDQLDLSFLSIGGELAGTKRWENGAITATAKYDNLGPYMNLIKQNYNWKHAPESVSGAISLRQKTGNNGLFKLYTNLDDANFTLEQNDLSNNGAPYNYELNNNNFYLNSSWNGMLSEKVGMQLSTSFTNNSDNIEFKNQKINNSLKAYYLKDAFTYAASDWFVLKSGAEWFSKNIEQTVRVSDTLFTSNASENTLAAFSEAQLYTSNKFVSRVGLRAEYSDATDDWNLAPRLSTAYKIADNTQLSAAYGWFYQSPLNEYLLKTNQLKSERADHYTLTFLSTMKDRTFRAELYYKNYSNLVKYTIDPNGVYQQFSNDGSGYAKGFDLFWRDKKTIKNGNYWISYSYIDTKRNFRDYPLKTQPGFASKHNLSVVYKHWFNGIRSLAGINFNYSSPRPYDNPNTAAFNDEKTKAYKSLDLSWSFLYRQNIIIYGAVNNLPGFKNEYGRNFAQTPDNSGFYPSAAIKPSSTRFFVLACFITLTRKGDANQLDKIE